MANLLLLNCIVKDDVTPFPVEILSTETVALLKDAIKTELELRIPAKDLALWKVPEGTPEAQMPNILSGLNDANKLNPLLRLQHERLFPHGAADGVIHIVVQLPDSENHDQLFQGLDVSQDIESGKVTPGQYLILKVDFSTVNRFGDIETAEVDMNSKINSSIRAFYLNYAHYLGVIPGSELIKEKISNNGLESFCTCTDFVMDTLRDAKEKDDPLLGVKGIYL
ncbi:hypothetical protein EMPS_09868 [Entomortierella parvispora]|uniref:Crinkler effector protein N-terminal domain-containing protein n=1 Tax=Entomortierella parvispora TaxID=205924 RepID=A0A9P3HIT2_9FUNG|nr:hypothetical protein EMPS_09868 [Entomortierella parvispora]